ncbi:MAG: protein phosphatase CheZ [Candidatus Bathyarchaeia archaeon]
MIRVPGVRVLPGVPSYVKGVINLRGRIIPVVSLKKTLGPSGTDSGSRAVVVSAGRVTFSIPVDDIVGIVSIEDSLIEPVVGFWNGQGPVKGVARLEDRLIFLLDTGRLLPLEDQSLLEEEIVEVHDRGDRVEVVKKIGGMAGEVLVREIVDPVKFYEERGISRDDPKYLLLEEITNFMDAVSQRQYDEADRILNSIIQKSQGGLFREIGRVARKLHESLKSFREIIDPGLKEIALEHMPEAADQLEAVIGKTEEAADRTIGIVEKHLLKMDELAEHIRAIQGPEDSVQFLRDFKDSLAGDLMEILTVQSFQDLTGQIIKRVIALVRDLESELLRLITTSSLEIEERQAVKKVERVTQQDIDRLLKEFEL